METVLVFYIMDQNSFWRSVVQGKAALVMEVLRCKKFYLYFFLGAVKCRKTEGKNLTLETFLAPAPNAKVHVPCW